MNCVLINYPAAEKRQWDGVVTRISNTLASRSLWRNQMRAEASGYPGPFHC
jgi:hypothetical protein